MRQSKKTVRATSKTGKRAAAVARWGGFSWKRLLLILPLMGLLSLVWGIWEWRQSRAYAAQFELVAIEVNGLRLLTGEDVLEASEIGDNVLEVDLRAVANRLGGSLGEACGCSKPPDRLVVELVERQRFAWVALDQTMALTMKASIACKSPGQRNAYRGGFTRYIGYHTCRGFALFGNGIGRHCRRFGRRAHLVEAGDIRGSRILYGYFSAGSTER